MSDVVAGLLVLFAALLSLVAGVALLRFPDSFSRLHAATKPAVLGVVLATAGAALRQQDARTIATLLLVAVFQVLTAPLAGHVIARAAHRGDEAREGELVLDELADRETTEEPR